LDTLSEEQSAALARKVERRPDGSVQLLVAHRPLKQAPALLLRPGTVGVLQDGAAAGPVVRWAQRFSLWLAIHDAEATLISKVASNQLFYSATPSVCSLESNVFAPDRGECRSRRCRPENGVSSLVSG